MRKNRSVLFAAVKRALLTILAASLLSPITARAAATGHAFHRHQLGSGPAEDAGRRVRRRSRCASAARPTCGRGRRRAALTARASRGSSTPTWASACRTRATPSGRWDATCGRHALRPGDLVFFDGLGHVGLWIGHGRFIHAPQTGEVVSVASLSHGWYARTYSGAVRLPGTQRVHRARRHAAAPRASGRARLSFPAGHAYDLWWRSSTRRDGGRSGRCEAASRPRIAARSAGCGCTR